MIKETKTRHFFYLLFALCLIYNYQNILKLGPRSTHQWRQADALSFSLNYLNDGMKLFEPKIHAQYALNGKSVGEFPIVYYINAFVWKVTGINYITPRLLILLLSFMGLFFLFKAGKLLLEDGFWSLLLPIVLFTSPVFVFYANNFLVNIPALSFLFGAWYFLLKFRLNFTRKYLIISVLFFAISLLLRSTMIMGYLPVLLIYFLELFGILKPLVSRKKVADFLLLFIPFFVLSAWYLFAKNYNRVNHSVDFLITFRPIWVAENIGDIWVKFYNELLPNFHFGFVGTLILAAFLFLLAAIKKMPPHFTLFLVLIALEIVSLRAIQPFHLGPIVVVIDVSTSLTVIT